MPSFDFARLATTWNYPTVVRFGAGASRELPAACAAAGIARPLVVTDPGLARLPVVDRVMGLLHERGAAARLFAEVRPNPVAANVEAGVRAFRDGRHDGVVAVGGGSALDTGKVVAFMD